MELEHFDFDVLRPEIISLGKRRYRKLDYVLKGSKDTFTTGEQRRAEYDDDYCELESEIEQTEKGYRIKITDIPSFYFKFICGKHNASRKQIEAQTKCSINIPKPGKDGDIVITGATRSNVLSAQSQVQLLIETARARQKPTHFFCIPLNQPNIKSNFMRFKQTVLDACYECRGLEESIFQDPDRLHLTLGMAALVSDIEMVSARKKLATWQESAQRCFLSKGPISIRLQGIEYMNDDPGEVDVLYAKISSDKDNNRLQDLVDDLVEYLRCEGLVKREHDRVKLHATVMNTLFRETSASDDERAPIGGYQGARKDRRPRVTFDARQVLELCKDFDFGQTSLTSIEICTRGKFDSSGFYLSQGSTLLISELNGAFE